MIKKIKNNVTILNIVSNILLQITTILSGFIIPRIILSYFGSEVNGLVSSLNQFFGYMSLVEGGLTSVVMAKLYKPIINNDDKKISSIIKATQSFYSKLSIVFIIYTIILAIVYPIAFHTSFSFAYIFTLAIILGIGLLIQYNYALTLRTFLRADKKTYVVSFTQIFIYLVNIILFVVVVRIFPNIHFLKFITAILYFIQPIVYKKIVNKHINIRKDVKYDKDLLKSRWDGFSISLADFIYNNTDVIVLTSFSTLKTVSVYSVYDLVNKGLSQLIKSVSSAISPSIGQLYAKGVSKELYDKFDLYENIMFIISFFAYTIAGLLITPFVMIYTKGVTDANYYQPIFGVILVMAGLVSCIKEPYVQLSYSANKFKQIKKPAYIEAILNIVISIVLVYRFGLIGVAIGTLIAMIYRVVFQVLFLKKELLSDRKKFIFIKKILTFSLISIICVILCLYLYPIKKYTLLSWLTHSIVYSIILIILYFSVFIIICKDKVLEIKKNLINK